MLVKHAHALGDADRFGSTVEDVRRYGFGEDPAFNVLLAEQDNEVVGLVVFFYVFSTWRGRLGVYVQDIHVVEAVRASGTGRRLLAAAAAQGRADGCTHLRLSVATENGRARTFYERIGLDHQAHEVIYQAAGEDFDHLADRLES